MKPFFPIIMWLEAAPERMGFNQDTAAAFFDRSFEDIASLNCNTIRPSNLPLGYVDQLLTTAANHGLTVILDPMWGNNLMKMTPGDILNIFGFKTIIKFKGGLYEKKNDWFVGTKRYFLSPVFGRNSETNL